MKKLIVGGFLVCLACLGVAAVAAPTASAEDPYICKTPAALEAHDCPTVSPFSTVPLNPNRAQSDDGGLLGLGIGGLL